jgi:hypothetical protein
MPARQALVTSLAPSEVVLQQRSIAWLARRALSISLWGPGGLAESAACSLVRSPHSCCIWLMCRQHS